jgi:CheY-like chemotaxis protein
MGERILSDEGYEVVTVSNADSALIRLDDADPDVVLADAVMPGRTGYDLCQYLKMSPRHRHVRVILTAGALEPIDEARAQLVQADGALEKPFQASALLAAVKPLAEAAAAARQGPEVGGQGPGAGGQGPEVRGQGPGAKTPAVPFVAVVDAEQVRAAVTLALDAAMGTMVDEIARRVLAALNAAKPETHAADVAAPAPPRPEAQLETPSTPTPPQAEPARPVLPLPSHAPREMVRRVTPLRVRTGSILGLDIANPELEASTPDPRPPAPDP